MSTRRETFDETSARAFAEEWVELWNRRDLDAILLHYADDVVFTSPRAEAVVGSCRVVSKAALRTYWSKALAGIQRLRFTLDRASWDPASREIAVIYTAEIDARCVRGCEVMRTGADGRVVEGEAFYGAPGTPRPGA